MTYDPYHDGNIEPPDGLSLAEYAKAWIDMEPHVQHLQQYAAGRRSIVEFGVRGAVSTWAMLDAMAPDGHLYGVDLCPDFEYLRQHNLPYPGYASPVPPRVRKDPRFHFILGDSVRVTGLPMADLVMIDSSHEFVQTVRELHRAAELNPDYIILHDYLYSETPGVRRAVDGYSAKGYLRDEPYVLLQVYPSKWGLAVLGRR